MAERYGAKALDPTASDFKSTLLAACDNRGPDVVLEVVGHPGALYSALELVRKAGVVSSCGVHIAPLTMVGDDLYAKGVKMVFGRCHVRGVFEESMGLLKRVTERTPELIDEFVQKKIRIDEAVEVSLVDKVKCPWLMISLSLFLVLQALQRAKDRKGGV
jgi:threonine dehydrogenase-like Zn-dependent dehydrogenase